MVLPGADGPEAFMSENHDADATIDLSGMGAVEAVAAVRAGLAEATRLGQSRLWFRFAMAADGGGQTLFQPVGRTLRDALKDGQIVRAMPAARGGWIARLRADD
jgi:Mor family transcriptional regulator